MTVSGQKVYKRILDRLMSSVHRRIQGEQYEYGQVYTAEELRQQVTQEELMRWLNIRTFGVADAGRDMAIKPKVRANTLAFWKKSSFFFYAGLPAWLDLWVEE